MKYLKTLFSAVLAGICIGIGGTVCLSVDNRIMGAFLFSIGLFMIVTNGFSLFTGKVGYLLENKPAYLLDLLIIWIGNFIGTNITALVLLLTRLEISSEKMVQIKISDNPLSIFILSIFCGMLMFLAVNGYKTVPESNGAGKCIAVILPVAVFILCGFEHCVANMFYFALAQAWSLKSILYVLLMTLGNALGSLIFASFMKTKKAV